MRYYIDMDGVLVIYDRTAYEPKGDQPALFMQKGAHYFRNLNPDPKMIQVVNMLLDCPEHEVYILTAVSNQGSICLEQIEDKIEWTHENLPRIDTETQFLAVISNEKPEIAEFIKFKCEHGPASINGKILTVEDVLIDDYNKNLTVFRSAGGQAIKYLNGINSAESYKDGLVLDQEMSAEDIFLLLTKHLNYFRK